MDPRHLGGLAGDIIAVVSVEGPIYESVLRDRLKEIHGVGRAGGNIQTNVANAIAAGDRRGQLVVAGYGAERVISIRGTELDTFRVPGDGIERAVEEVPPEELKLAIAHLVETQFGMQRDRIPSEVAGLFGYTRARAPSADYTPDVIDSMIERGELRVSGPNLYLP